MARPIAEKNGDVCPLHQKPVEKVCHKCPLYIQVRGMDMNTGKDVDHWACALAWVPALLIENSGMQRQTGAAVESFRNEMVKANTELLRAQYEAKYPPVEMQNSQRQIK